MAQIAGSSHREMCRKNQRRLAIVQELVKSLDVGLGEINPASLGLLPIVAPEPVEVRNFCAHAAKVLQHPRRIASISDLFFSGKAATRLARPIRFSGRKGPIVRIIQPAKSDILFGIGQPDSAEEADCKRSKQRIACAFEAALQATNHSPHLTRPGYVAHELCRRTGPHFSGHALEIHDHLAEHLSAFHSGEAALKIGEWHRYR